MKGGFPKQPTPLRGGAAREPLPVRARAGAKADSKAGAAKVAASRPKKVPQSVGAFAGEAGRPTAYSARVRDAICQAVTEGKHWRQIEREGLATQYELATWLRTIPEFHEHYSRAREARAESLVAEIDEILDELKNGSKAQWDDPLVQQAYQSFWLASARMRLDTLRWQVSCYFPKCYGTKVQVEARHEAASAVQYDYSRLSLSQAKKLRELMEICRVKHETD